MTVDETVLNSMESSDLNLNPITPLNKISSSESQLSPPLIGILKRKRNSDESTKESPSSPICTRKAKKVRWDYGANQIFTFDQLLRQSSSEDDDSPPSRLIARHESTNSPPSHSDMVHRPASNIDTRTLLERSPVNSQGSAAEYAGRRQCQHIPSPGSSPCLVCPSPTIPSRETDHMAIDSNGYNPHLDYDSPSPPLLPMLSVSNASSDDAALKSQEATARVEAIAGEPDGQASGLPQAHERSEDLSATFSYDDDEAQVLGRQSTPGDETSEPKGPVQVQSNYHDSTVSPLGPTPDHPAAPGSRLPTPYMSASTDAMILSLRSSNHTWSEIARRLTAQRAEQGLDPLQVSAVYSRWVHLNCLPKSGRDRAASETASGADGNLAYPTFDQRDDERLGELVDQELTRFWFRVADSLNADRDFSCRGLLSASDCRARYRDSVSTQLRVPL